MSDRNAQSVRRNPKDSRLVKLRCRQAVECTAASFDSGPRWHENRVPGRTTMRVPDGTN
jgi:hypothetical protein